MNKKTWWVVHLAVVLGAALPALAIEVPLAYVRCDKDAEAASRPSSTYVSCEAKAPAGEWKLPPLVSKEPQYSMVRIVDQERLMIFDQEKPEDTFYTRVYFDANGNRDLTDDAVISGTVERTGALTEARFSPIEFAFTVGGKQLSYSMTPEATRFNPGAIIGFALRMLSSGIDKPLIRLNSNCVYAGEFDLDGHHYRVTLLDENVDGRFDERLTVMPPFQDEIEISSHGDSISLQDTAEDSTCRTRQTLGNVLVLGETLFEVDLRIAEGKMVLTPYTGDASSALLPASFETLTLYSDEPNQKGVMMFRPAQKIPLPCGSYRLLQYDILRSDEQGDRWILSAVGTKEGAAFAVAKGADTPVVLGEPFSPVVTVAGGKLKRSFFGGTSAQLEVITKGAGNEKVSDVAHMSGRNTKLPLADRDPRSPKEPRYKVTKADGEIASEGAFRYG